MCEERKRGEKGEKGKKRNKKKKRRGKRGKRKEKEKNKDWIFTFKVMSSVKTDMTHLIFFYSTPQDFKSNTSHGLASCK